MAINWKHTVRFCLTAFCMDFATGMILVILPYAILQLGGDSMSLGAATVLRGVGYGASCMILGHFSDIFNRKILMGVSVFCISVSFLLIAFASHLNALYFAILLWMLALGPFWPAVFSWLGDSHDPKELGRVSNATNLSWSMGGMLGGIASGWLFTYFDQIVFLFAIMPVIFAWFFLGLHACPHNRPQKKVKKADAEAGSKRLLAAGLIAVFAATSLVGLTGGVFPAYGITLGIDSKIFGVLLACTGLGRTAVFLAGMRWNYFLARWHVVFTLQIIAAVMVAGIAIMSALWWLIPTFFIAGMCLGTCYYRGLLSVLEIPGSRGFKTGLFESTLLSGIMLGGFLGGYLAETYGLRSPYLAIGGLTFLFLLLQSLLIGSARRSSNIQ